MQTKEKLSNQEFYPILRSMTVNALTEYFNKNPKEMKKITDRIKSNAKARVESTKIRNSVIRGETTNFDEHLMENFVPANNRGKNDYTELFLIEGKSAKGTCDTGRFDRNTQAVFSLRGVPLNAFGMQIDKVLLNAEFNSLVKILGCNIGERFDINKLKYNKIIIMSDADSDGYNITSLVCAFFITHLPDIIREGRLYKSVTPLYKIKSKYKEFILNKQEYVRIYEKQVRDNLIIVNPDTNKVYTDVELQNILMQNRPYLDMLTKLSNHLVVNSTVLEYILIHRHEKDFVKKFHKEFPELNIDDSNVMTGIYEGKYQILIMDYLFEKRIKNIENFIAKVNSGRMYFNVLERTNSGEVNRGKMTLGQFLIECQRFQPVIKTRFKGVGELNANDLRDNALDPSNRILIRLTIDDIERDLAQFNILHGNDSDERANMMKHFQINSDDLDN